MNILGLNVFHADTAACLLIDGEIKYATEEERFTRIKHFAGFPINSINFCLKSANLSMENIDYITVNFDSSYNFKEKIKYSLLSNPISILKKMMLTYQKNSLQNLISVNFAEKFNGTIVHVPHHLSHIASSYLCSGFNKAIGLSFDGAGDFSTIESYFCEKNQMDLINKTIYPDSIGIFYQAFTQFLGFKNYGDEYKVMGLSSYGKPIYAERLKKEVIHFQENTIKLNLQYFSHHTSNFSYYFENGIPIFENLYSKKLSNLFGKPRTIDEKISNFHKDLAASVQTVFEEYIIKILNNLYDEYKVENLVLAGGCAFNSVLNGKLKEKTKFKDIYISSNAGDAGGAIGSALYQSSKVDKAFINKKEVQTFFGTKYDNKYIEDNIIRATDLKALGYESKYFKNFNELVEETTEHLNNKKVIAWFQDRMEWGPRALGNRSILADPRDPNMRNTINLKVKRREDFRPFAPAILEEYVEKFIVDNEESDFMSYVSKAKSTAASEIPSAVHIDGTCRFQTVKKANNRKFYDLINSFYKKTGVPVLLNTSLNINDPICENPSDAFELFAKTSVDVLVIQNWILTKN